MVMLGKARWFGSPVESSPWCGRSSTRRSRQGLSICVWEGLREMDERLRAARGSLAAADAADGAVGRYHEALAGAWAAARVLLADRGQAGDSWLALAHGLPELGEWAAYFDTASSRLTRARAAQLMITAREADDLLRDAQVFHAEVERRLARRGRGKGVG